MINLKNGWSIDADGKCYILQQFAGTDKKGKKIYKNQSFHSTLTLAVQNFMNLEQMKVVNAEEMTLAQAVGELVRLKAEHEIMLKEIEEVERL